MDNQIAGTQLRVCVEEIEQQASPYRHNAACLRDLAGAARLLGEHATAARGLRLLRAVPDAAFLPVLANFDLPGTVPKGLRAIPSVIELEEAHPPYREETITSQITAHAKSEPHIALCLDGRIHEARSAAETDLALAELGATLAVLGEFDATHGVLRDPVLPESRRSGIWMVLAIELFRRGRCTEAQSVLTEFESSGLDSWCRIHLALGFAGREPWCGYPYPDW